MSRPAGRDPNGTATTRGAATPRARSAAEEEQLKKPSSGRLTTPARSSSSTAGPASEGKSTNTQYAVTQLGVTLRGLRKLRRIWREEFPNFNDKTTGDIAKEWVRDKKTVHKKCRMLELSEVVDPADVAPPMYFISHAWQSKLSLLLDYLLDNFLLAASDSTTVWLDILAVNQHRGTPENTLDVQAFDQVVKVCSGGTIVVLDASSLATCNPAKRAWCIYEWAHTLKAHGPDGFFMDLSPEHRAVVVGSLDIREAECKEPKDKEMILATVRKQFTSAGRFNDKLKLQLLLEPLTYRVDIRRLMEHAKGTSWELGDVQSWLREGTAGRRVLCIAAGAGEGKSTISAVLCSTDHGSSGSSGRSRIVHAHHFLKYSDQRRLEPVRIIKSLAFQLASRIPSVCQELLELNVAEVAQLTSVEEAFTKLLLQPLRHLELVKPVVLLIDALDEADPVERLQLAKDTTGSMPTCPKACGNQALQLIATHLCHLPAFVRFIFTTRPDAATDQVLKCLERTFPCSVLHLAPSALRSRNESSNGNTSNSGRSGVMVYHTAVAACGKGVSIPKLQHSAILEDVYKVYSLIFDSAYSRYNEQQAELVANLLSVLVAANEPLPYSFLQQLRLGDGLHLLPGYPKLFFIDDHHLYLMHKSLGDWLLDPVKSGAYAARVQKGHAWLGLYLAKIWQRTQQKKQAVSLGRGSSAPYLLKYAVSHLAMASDSVSAAAAAAAAGAGRTIIRPELIAKAAATLDELLQDFSFLAAVLRAGHGPAAIGALGAIRKHTDWSGEMLRWLRNDRNNRYYSIASAEMLTEWACAAPINTKVYKLATGALGPQSWRTRLVLPVKACSWPECLAVIEADNGAVTSLAYSPDGRQLATAAGCQILRRDDIQTDDHSYSVRLWDRATGQCTATLQGHLGSINGIAFSRDGRQLVSCSSDTTVCLWDVATGQCITTLQGHTGAVMSVAFNQNGQQVASGSADMTVRLWHITTGKCTHGSGHSKVVTSVAFSPDGLQLASGSNDKTLRLWNAMGQCTATLEYRGDTGGYIYPACVAFSPDGKKVVFSNGHPTLKLWDLASRTFEWLKTGNSPVHCVAFSPYQTDGCYGCRLAVGHSDNSVTVWDVATQEYVNSLQGHTSTVYTVAFSPNGDQLASGGHDSTLRLWDPPPSKRSGQERDDSFIQKPRGRSLEASEVRAVAFSPDGCKVASIADNWLCIWDSATGQCTDKVEANDRFDGAFVCVAFSRNGEQLATGREIPSFDGLELRSAGFDLLDADSKIPPDSKIPLVLWDSRRSDNMIRTVLKDEPSVASLDFNGKRNYGSLLKGHTALVCGVAFSPDGKQLVSTSADCTVRIWDSTTRQCTATLKGNPQGGPYSSVESVNSGLGVSCVAYHPGGRQLAYSNHEKTVCIWDTATRKCTTTLKGFKHVVRCVAYSSDGRQLATGCSQDGGYAPPTLLRIWDTSTWRCTTEWQLDDCHAPSMVFNPTDSRLMACCSKGDFSRIKLWDTTTGQCISRLSGHSNGVLKLAFSRDGSQLISGSRDYTMRLWDTRGMGAVQPPTSTTASKGSRGGNVGRGGFSRSAAR